MNKKERLMAILVSILLIVLLMVLALTFNQQSKQNIQAQNSQQAEEKQEETAAQPLTLEEWAKKENIKEADMILDDLEDLSAEEIIRHYQEELQIPDNYYAVTYQNLQSDDTFNHRQDDYFVAASTTKVILAMIFMDLVDQGELDMDSAIPYVSSCYQDGNGQITADVAGGQSHPTYTLDYTMKEMIVSSDNTATLMLRLFYRNNYGSLEEAFQKVLGLDESQYSQHDIYYNNCSTHILQQALKICLQEERYDTVLFLMKNSDQPFDLSTYLNVPMHAKYGSLFENQHDAGIFFWQDQPQYILIFMTQYLTEEQANQFMGGSNFQLAVQAAYKDYLKDFE